MNKKIVISVCLAVILLLLPISTNAGETQTKNYETAQDITIDLTRTEYDIFCNNIKNLFIESDISKSLIKEKIDESVFFTDSGDIKLDFDKVVDEISTLLVENNADLNALEMQSYELSMMEQSAGSVQEQVSMSMWDEIIRPFLNNNFGINTWPSWREDNDMFDGDLGTIEGEKNPNLYDIPILEIKYDYQGLDDKRDWNCLASFLFAFGLVGLATIICLLTLVLVIGLYGLTGVILGYGFLYCVFLESFDIKDLPYGDQLPYTPPDGM